MFKNNSDDFGFSELIVEKLHFNVTVIASV